MIRGQEIDIVEYSNSHERPGNIQLNPIRYSIKRVELG